MTAEELIRRIKAKKAPVLLDVRSNQEFTAGHIAGAVHAPLGTLLKATAAVVKNKDDLLVVVCEHGPRAQLARMFLKINGYKNLELLAGHMVQWRHSRGPMKKGT